MGILEIGEVVRSGSGCCCCGVSWIMIGEVGLLSFMVMGFQIWVSVVGCSSKYF